MTHWSDSKSIKGLEPDSISTAFLAVTAADLQDHCCQVCRLLWRRDSLYYGKVASTRASDSLDDNWDLVVVGKKSCDYV